MFDRINTVPLVLSAAILALASPAADAQCLWEASLEVSQVRVLLAVSDDPFVLGPALYATGFFTEAGGVPANHIARWDGSSWSALGEGLGGKARHMAIFNGELYVGTTGQGPLKKGYIARWDDTNQEWSAFAVLDGAVKAMVVFNDGTGEALYVGGEFESIKSPVNLTVNGIAKFNGTTWSDLDGGFTKPKGHGNRRVPAGVSRFGLVVDGTDLYVAGDFDQAGEEPANHIARWDGMFWSALGNGLDGGGPLAVANGELYVGINFRSGGASNAWYIAEWNGLTWEVVDDGVVGGIFDGYARTLASFNDGTGDALYVGGGFQFDTGVNGVASNIVRWDPVAHTWSALVGDSTSCCGSTVWTLAVFDDDGAGLTPPDLYAGGAGTFRWSCD